MPGLSAPAGASVGTLHGRRLPMARDTRRLGRQPRSPYGLPNLSRPSSPNFDCVGSPISRPARKPDVASRDRNANSVSAEDACPGSPSEQALVDAADEQDRAGSPIARLHFAQNEGNDMPARCMSAFTSHMRGETEPTPKTLSELWIVFLTHPSIILIVASVFILTALRALMSPGFGIADAVVVAGVAGFWLLQEWFIHAKLLHSSADWLGKRIHEGHHALGYFHISIDPPSIIIPAMCLAAGVMACFLPGPLGITATITYYFMGLVYEFNHYMVHTRYVPKSTMARAIRRHHMLHHNRNPNYWLSFTVPQVDIMFGTNPRPSAVPHDP